MNLHSSISHHCERSFVAACVLSLVCTVITADATAAAPQLKVGENRRFLVKEDGAPFFYLGDTSWELFHRLNREEAEFYLKNRAAKGFTVIQAVVLAELDGLKTPNAYGHMPLKDNDPTRPVEEYFQHVDFVVNKAAELGLFIGLLPTWGDKWSGKGGPAIFTPENAEVYGEFIGRRYQDKPVIWILGGDRIPQSDAQFATIRAMARGLKKGHGGRHLMTFHPLGPDNSARYFHEDDWLDFNMSQSGHFARHWTNYAFTVENYQRTPVKPTLDGEPRYEDHPINWKPADGWFDDWDVRQAAYWSLLSGACGHTYGNHNVWQFWQPDRNPVSSARTPWRQALDHPGAIHMGHLRRLFESRPWQTLVPDQEVLQGDVGTGGDMARAARASDDSFVFVYVPTGRPVIVRFYKLSGSRINVYWFDPRVGTALSVGMFATLGMQRFEPFSRGQGNDWVLVLDDVSKQYPKPGEKKK